MEPMAAFNGVPPKRNSTHLSQSTWGMNSSSAERTGQEIAKRAYHEAGHAVAYWVLGYKVRLVTIVADEVTNTRGRTEPCDGQEQSIEHALIIACAGPAAQVKSGGLVHDEDVRRDYEKVLCLQSKYGLDDVTREACRARARDLVKDHWDEIEALAQRLLTEETVTYPC
jgi:ATP-dependent Zn protease